MSLLSKLRGFLSHLFGGGADDADFKHDLDDWKSSVLTALREVLRPAGFVLHGGRFVRRESGCVQVVLLQVATLEDRGAAMFTFTIGACYREFSQLALPDLPAEVDLHYIVRAGDLAGKKDLWWVVDSWLGAKEAASEIATLCANRALHAFAKTNSFEAFSTLIENRDPLVCDPGRIRHHMIKRVA